MFMLEKELIKNLTKIKNLEAAGRPKDAWVVSAKDILLSQISPIESKTEYSEQSPFGDVSYYSRYFGQLLQQRVLKPVGAFVAVLAVMLSYTAAVSVASASLPGDMLYPVKTAAEQVQLALTLADDKKVQLKMDFVSRRVDELQQLAIKKDETTEVQTKKVTVTVQKISQDIQDVKKDLNKITAASASTKASVLTVAKDVDTKTLQVEQGLVQTKEVLSQEVKKEVAPELAKAIAHTEETGASALGVIVENHKAGTVAETEVVTRVTERIKKTEESIQTIANDVDDLVADIKTASTTLVIATTTPNTVITSTSTIASTTITSTTTTTTSTSAVLGALSEQPKQAQAIINEAKSLLDQKDFSSALQKIQESKELVTGVASTVGNISDSLPANVTSQTVATTTSVIIVVPATSTVATGTISSVSATATTPAIEKR